MNINRGINEAVPQEHHLRQTSAPCRVHFIHKPRSHQNHEHHVWPLGLGGPDTPENLVVVCPTGHYNIHLLLKKWIKEGGDPGSSVRKTFTKGEQMWAEIGYRRYNAKSMLLETT